MPAGKTRNSLPQKHFPTSEPFSVPRAHSSVFANNVKSLPV
jgi:hypothetical protein